MNRWSPVRFFSTLLAAILSLGLFALPASAGSPNHEGARSSPEGEPVETLCTLKRPPGNVLSLIRELVDKLQCATGSVVRPFGIEGGIRKDHAASRILVPHIEVLRKYPPLSIFND